MTMTNKISSHGSARPILALALLASVLLNMLVIGSMLGLMPGLHGCKHFGPMALSYQHGEFMEERLTQLLAPADAAAFHDAMQPHMESLRQAHAHVREATRDVAAAYEQEPHDSAALQSALDRLKQARDEVNDVVAGIILDSGAKLSPDGRHRLAEMTR